MDIVIYMIRKNIILLFLLFISLNIFSQTERETGNIPNLELKEAYETIDMLQLNSQYLKDSLKDCKLNQIGQTDSLIESFPLFETGCDYEIFHL